MHNLNSKNFDQASEYIAILQSSIEECQKNQIAIDSDVVKKCLDEESLYIKEIPGVFLNYKWNLG